MSQDLMLGAVAYDPKVVTIWEGFRKYFLDHGLGFDFVLYSNYEAQVRAHLGGHFDVAWNSPLAWIETLRDVDPRAGQAAAIAMRDTDCDLTSVIVVREGGPVDAVEDLRGRTLGVGAADSPQATLIPLLHLAEKGLEPGKDIQVVVHDVLRGKHGDHIGGERDGARSLMAGTADAACMIDGNYLAFLQDGTLSPGATRILARTGRYDHCNFTVLGGADGDAIRRFQDLLFAMDYGDPEIRPLLDMEGLKTWKPGRTSGYELLSRAVDRFGTAVEFREAAGGR